MYKSLRFFVALILFACGIGSYSAYAALDCTAVDAQYCDGQPTSLKTDVYSEVSWTTPSPCCLFNCASNATHNNTISCVCKAGYYLKNNSDTDCTACPTGTFNTAVGTSDQCTICPAGKFNIGTGNRNCNFSCNKPNVKSYALGSWNNGNTVQPCIIESCHDHYELTNNNTECKGKAYKITLDKNLSALDINKEVWVIYGSGFADNANGKNLRADPEIKPSVWWGHTFIGYFTAPEGGVIRFDNNGMRTNGTTNKSFTEDTKLYAHWDSDPYKVYYYEDDAQENLINGLQYGNPQTCYFDNSCQAPAGPGKNGKVFSHWKCGTGCSGTINAGAQLPQPQTDETLKNGIKLVGVWQNCPKGYYCSNGRQEPCPMGSTSNEGATSIESCFMVRGNNGTKFCDSVGCFYLPGTGNIYY